MKPCISKTRAASRQGGAALIVGLVLLLIITVLGVSGLNTATVEVRMADNEKQYKNSFQAAESALAAELAGGATLVLDGTELPDMPVRADGSYRYDLGANEAGESQIVTATVTTNYSDRLLATSGQEIGSGASIQHVHFEMVGTSTAARGATSEQRMGFYVRAPAP